MNFNVIHSGAWADSEVQAALILGAESAASRDFLNLLLAVPEKTHFSPYSAAITGAALQLKLDPLISCCDLIFIDQQRGSLVRCYRIERAIIVQISQHDSSSVIAVGRSYNLRHFFELSSAVIDPNALLLIARKARAFQ